MKFKNTQNGYIEETSLTFLWVLLFGVFYFLYKKIWNHFFISLGLGIITAGISWFIYPFYGKGIVRQHYLRNGWIEVSETGEELDSDIEKEKEVSKLLKITRFIAFPTAIITIVLAIITLFLL